MGSPFKMNPKTPLMKALVGKQKNLPEQLKQAILDAPAQMTGNGGKKDSITGTKRGYKDIEKKDPDVFTKTYNAATGMTHPNGQGYDYNKREAYKKNAISKYGSMANSRAYYRKLKDKN